MKKEELKKKLEPKKFNDVTMEFLTTAVNDVLELYGEYISEDVIIERIKQNLDKDIEFERNLGKNIAGSYNFGEKNIKIKKKSIDEERQVFFHEFLQNLILYAFGPRRLRYAERPGFAGRGPRCGQTTFDRSFGLLGRNDDRRRHRRAGPADHRRGYGRLLAAERLQDLHHQRWLC